MPSSRLLRPIFWLSTLVMIACGSPGADPMDAGDGGLSLPDAATTEDGSIMELDAGPLDPDGGPPERDAGSPVVDAGIEPPPTHCTLPTDCAPLDCYTRSCEVGSCVYTPMADGTPAPAGLQVADDCGQLVCDGDGGTRVEVDDTDGPPDDANPCTVDACDGGPQHTMVADGTVVESRDCWETVCEAGVDTPRYLVGSSCDGGLGICGAEEVCVDEAERMSMGRTNITDLFAWRGGLFASGGPWSNRTLMVAYPDRALEVHDTVSSVEFATATYAYFRRWRSQGGERDATEVDFFLEDGTLVADPYPIYWYRLGSEIFAHFRVTSTSSTRATGGRTASHRLRSAHGSERTATGPWARTTRFRPASTATSTACGTSPRTPTAGRRRGAPAPPSSARHSRPGGKTQNRITSFSSPPERSTFSSS